MAVVYMDGWDYISPNNFDINTFSKYLQADGWYNVNTQYGGLFTVTGRFGFGTALGINASPGGNGGTKSIDTRLLNGYILGFAFYNNNAQNCDFWLYDGYTDSIAPLHINFNQSGILQFTIGSVTYRTRTGGVRNGSWNYLQIKHTAAEFRVYVNGNLQVLVTNPTPPLAFDAYRWNNQFNQGQVYVDDMYILDPTTGDNTDFLGNVVVRTQLPYGNGDTIQFTPNGNPANWQNVIDYHMLDANFNSDATVGQYDLYNMNPNAAARDIFALQVKTAFSQDNGVQLYGASRIKVGGVEYTGTQKGVPQLPGYETVSSYYDKNPNSGVAWTTYDLNHLQAGPLLAASD